jgi:hypothetical protein
MNKTTTHQTGQYGVELMLFCAASKLQYVIRPGGLLVKLKNAPDPIKAAQTVSDFPCLF